MLGYQHLYHAGNRADVHKHALLAWMLDYLTRKDKPLSYVETHAGRGLYDLDAPEARRTGEAAGGIDLAEARGWFAPDHPYARALAQIRAQHGPRAYPGSPALAAARLRPTDRMWLAEKHPAEHAALAAALGDRPGLRLTHGCGLQMARALCPPTLRRGLMLVDPSYEGAADYAAIPPFLARIHRVWPVAVLVLWYPLLHGAPHAPMLAGIRRTFPDALCHEVGFPPSRPGHRMTGSGMVVVNPPWGIESEAARLTGLFATL